jgi:chromatin remodeling complex protein RSC6
VAVKAVKASKAAAPVAAPVAEVVPAVAPVAEVAEEDLGAQLQKAIAELHEQLAGLKSAASNAAAALKGIEKQAARVIKKADRRRKRSTKTEGGVAAPCVFNQPAKITDELCSFLGKPKGTTVARSDVTKGVLAYAKSHNLMDKQTIKADAALRKLLTLSETDVLTILNLQTFLKRHYIKKTA